MVESGRLEIGYSLLRGIGGSNPPLSSISSMLMMYEQHGVLYIDVMLENVSLFVNFLCYFRKVGISSRIKIGT